jgi:thioredoxin 1
MNSKKKIALIAVALVLLLGGIAAYLLTIGPLGKPVLATVNGEKITVVLFQKELEKIDPATRSLIAQDPGKLLDFLVNRTLLLQQAKKEGVTAAPQVPQVGQTGQPGTPQEQDRDAATIVTYLEKKVAALPPIAAEEVEQIYEAYRGQMAGRKKEEVLPLIRQMVEAQRQEEEAGRILAELRKESRIEIDGKALQKLTVVEPGMETQTEADFRKALKGGKPMVVDFGSNRCIPCRQLRPVLQKVRKDHEGKLEVLIIEIQKNQQLAAEYQIQVMPTVVFIDKAGKEVFRHQGFMSEEKIKEQLAKMGVG